MGSPTFTFRQINVFRAVMTTGSVTGASHRLNLSQPSVSRLLGEIEEQFGCPLFERKSRGVAPTQEALLFLEEIERTYGALATLEEAAREIAQNKRGTLTFGTIAAFAFDIAPRALSRLGVGQNSISVRWRIRNSTQLINWARTGGLDLGIAYFEGDLSGVRVLLRETVPHMCLMPKTHKLAKLRRRSLHLSDLAQERIIALIGVTEETLRRRFIGAKDERQVVAETSFAAAALAEHGGGVAIVDPFSAHAFTKSGNMTAVVVADMAPYEFALFEPIEDRSSRMSAELKKILMEEIRKAVGITPRT
jgi:DNA-binding transcriptional LysR family regulator